MTFAKAMNLLRVFPTARCQNNDDHCEVCFHEMPTDITLISCEHRQNFCEKCIRSLIVLRKYTCPKCRTIWPVLDYLEKTNQSIVNIANISLKLKYPASFTGNISPLASLTAGDLIHGTVMCCSIGFLVCLIIYPTIK
ncbi:unnamed protein product [Rotaria sp. Silwood1]|nr:unnamed protein product [Rotaria sp. Silwood1]CAF0735104.1 unnamed protein product [Rotaria sp. Silwood1]CAF0789160.1 unnamed protein product [Rotaria sp. Silwood1]CAF3326218.1 unnamed protein product [Rotaria sp. Silwood1]CAF3333691.1 unnamed protein product [Rotaria sp. Silwood1]